MTENRDDRITVRDLDRIREKVTIRLEPRHLWLAGFGFAGLIAASFLFGVLVGRSCEIEASPQTSATQEMPVQDPVGQKEVPAPKRSIRPVPRALVAPKARALAAPLTSERRETDNISVATSSNDLVSAPFEVCDPSAQMSCLWSTPCEPNTETYTAEYIFNDVFSAHISLSKRLREDFSNLAKSAKGFVAGLMTSTEKKAAEPPPQAKPAPNLFTVQVRSYKDAALANEFAAMLRSQGYTVEVVPHEDGSGQVWFRVRVGRFRTLEEARNFAARLNERTGDRAIVTAMEIP